MSRLIIDSINRQLTSLNQTAEGLCQGNGQTLGCDRISKIRGKQMGGLTRPSQARRKSFLAKVLNPVTAPLMKIVDLVFSIQPFSIIGKAISFTIINIPRALLLPILKKINSFRNKVAYSNLERLKVYNVINIAEQSELKALVGKKEAFREKFSRVLDRLQKENKITEQEVQQLRRYNDRHLSTKVLTKLTLKTARYEANKLLQDVESLRVELGKIEEHTPNRDYILSQIDNIISRAKQKGKWRSSMDRDLSKQLLAFFETLSPEERKKHHFEALYAHLEYRQAHGKSRAAKIFRSHLYYREKEKELDSMTGEWLEMEKQVKAATDALKGASSEEKEEMQGLLKKVEASLVDLDDSYGMICTMMAEDRLIAPVASDMVGTFRYRLDVLNSLLGLVRMPISGRKYTHIVSGDHLKDSPHDAWPMQDSYFAKEALLEGKDIEQYDVGDEKLVVNETVLPGSPSVARQPRVLLFNCDVGNGHRSATKAVVQSLPDCIVHVGDVYGDIFREFDFGAKFAPELSQQNVANYLAKKERYRTLNFIGNFVDIAFNKDVEKRMEAVLERYVRQHNPDVLVSVIPVLNGVFANVATKLGKKFYIVPADEGIKDFCRGITQEHCENENIHVLYPYDKHEAQKILGSKLFGRKPPEGLLSKIEDNVGYPARCAFNQQVSAEALDELRTEYDIQDDENVMLVMMGGNTTNAPIDYARLISRMSDEQLDRISKNSDRKKFRLICLCGDTTQKGNKKLQDRLNAVNNGKKRNSRVTIHATKGTHRIPEMESLPEMFTLISKPGGASTGEAVKKGLPMIYHVGSTVLEWERPNMRSGEAKGLGKKFKATSSCSRRAQNKLAGILAGNFETRRKYLSGETEIKETKLDFTHEFRSKMREAFKGPYESSAHYLKGYPGFGTPVEKSGNKVTKSLLSKIFKVVLRVGFVAVASAGGALLFSATPLMGLAGGAAAAIGVLVVAKLVSFLMHRMYRSRKYRVKLPIEVVKHNTQEGPKPGQETKADVRVINDATLSFEWKKELIQSAKQSVECSFNYAGSENFRQILDILDSRMAKIPHFRVHLLMAPDLLEKEDKERLNELKDQYGDRFNFLISGKVLSVKKCLHREENHAKILVVDGKYFVVGGSGVHRKMNREEAPTWEKEKDKNLASFVIHDTFRDTDVVGCGEAAKGLRGQFFNLYYKWAVRRGKKLGASEGKYFPLDMEQPIAECKVFHEEENLHTGVSLKYVVGGPEHNARNPITSEYVRQIKAAYSTIRIGNLFFMPSPEVIKALKAVKEKPHVKVLGYFNGTPKGTKLVNYPLVATARQHYGLFSEVDEYNDPNKELHRKVATFNENTEDATAIVGSANHSPKSRYYDDEVVLVIKDKAVVDEITSALDEDSAKSKKITDTRRYRKSLSLLGKLMRDIYVAV